MWPLNADCGIWSERSQRVTVYSMMDDEEKDVFHLQLKQTRAPKDTTQQCGASIISSCCTTGFEHHMWKRTKKSHTFRKTFKMGKKKTNWLVSPGTRRNPDAANRTYWEHQRPSTSQREAVEEPRGNVRPSRAQLLYHHIVILIKDRGRDGGRPLPDGLCMKCRASQINTQLD